MRPNRNKYGVRIDALGRESRRLDNHVFASQSECDRYAELKWMQRAGRITKLELQPRFLIAVNGVHITTYKADFRYLDHHLRVVVEDVKGRRTEAYTMKARLMEAVFGIRILET